MARVTNDIINISGHLGDWTFYSRNGVKFARPRHIQQPRRLSRSQLAQREQLAHNNAVWRVLKSAKEVHFEGGAGPYYRFMSVNTVAPPVYLTKQQITHDFTLLLPETVVSDGPLRPLSYRLGELEGMPSLLTDLSVKDAVKGRLLLYTLHQVFLIHQQDEDDMPRLKVEMEEVDSTAITEVDGCVALKGERFADSMAGFALVHVVDGHVAQQRIVTNCNYYEWFTTEEALQEAAKSYGGLTGQ